MVYSTAEQCLVLRPFARATRLCPALGKPLGPALASTLHTTLSGTVLAVDSKNASLQPDRPMQRRFRRRFKGCAPMGNQFRARIFYEGRQVSLGSYVTEEEAARVVDEAHIFNGKQPANFPATDYDPEAILQHADFQAFKLHVRQVSAAKKGSRSPIKTSRYKGVLRSPTAWSALVPQLGRPLHLGSFPYEEEAAKAFDRSCILRGLPAYNFPDLAYDKDEVSKFATLEDFAHASRESGRQMHIIARGHWRCVLPVNGKFLVRYVFEGDRLWTHLGTYESRDDAKRAHDRACIFEGKDPVHFPKAEYTVALTQKQFKLDFVTFCQQMAQFSNTAHQNNRYTGVLAGKHDIYLAYVHRANRRKKLLLGGFNTQEEAARASDEARIERDLQLRNSLVREQSSSVTKEDDVLPA